MLAKRVATAVVLLAVLLPAIFVLPPIAWGVITLGFLAVGAWEWARLLPGAPRPVLAAGTTPPRPGADGAGPARRGRPAWARRGPEALP